MPPKDSIYRFYDAIDAMYSIVKPYFEPPTYSYAQLQRMTPMERKEIARQQSKHAKIGKPKRKKHGRRK